VRLEAAWVVFPQLRIAWRLDVARHLAGVLPQHPSFAYPIQLNSSSRLPPTQLISSTERHEFRDTSAQSACFIRSPNNNSPTHTSPRVLHTHHQPPAMLNLRSALVAATLAVSALAAPQLTVPATIPVTAATQIEVTWKDDGKAPTIAQLKSFTLQLFVGGNTAEDSVGRIE